MRAKSLAARRSGRSDSRDGRRSPPARMSSVTLFSRSSARPAPAAPMRHQPCGTPRTVSGSAAPSIASTKMSRPAVRQFSISRRGKPPLPATMPSLPAIRLLGLADRAARIRADEFEDVLDWGDAAKALGHLGHPIAQRAVGGKQELVGVAKARNVFAAETAPLHAVNVDPAEPRSLP